MGRSWPPCATRRARAHASTDESLRCTCAPCWPSPSAPSPRPPPQPVPGDLRALRQSTDHDTQIEVLNSLDCAGADPFAGTDDPSLPLITCATDRTEAFLLGPSRIDGRQVDTVIAGLNTRQARHEIDLAFTATGSDAWASLTRDSINKRVAFVLDSTVLSAPKVMQGPQMGGRTTISGDFTAESATALARDIRQTSTPLTVSSVDISVIRPKK
ncbi:hypothetical protein ACFWU5_13000 [Nocardia sp. NPDC058640]|uniref:SecDF P1 head subdomain-containing protein n=1 Tax=Nocardia sp. NPDC058640 TaxID=3346571 RepID=UPI00365316FF